MTISLYRYPVSDRDKWKRRKLTRHLRTPEVKAKRRYGLKTFHHWSKVLQEAGFTASPGIFDLSVKDENGILVSGVRIYRNYSGRWSLSGHMLGIKSYKNLEAAVLAYFALKLEH